MKTFIKITAIICALALLAGCGLIGESEKSIQKKEFENAVVMVNGDALSMERFNYYFYNEQDEILLSAGLENAQDVPKDFWQQKTDGKTNLEIAKEAALAAMINDFLKYQKAVEEGITLTVDEQKAIDDYMGQIKQSPETLSQLEMMQIDADTFEDIVVGQELVRKLVLKYVENGTIEVDKELVASELEKEYVKAQHILIMNTDSTTGEPLPEAEAAAKKAFAEELLGRVRAGEDFEALMLEFGEDPGVANAPEGYVFTTGQMVQEFEDAAFALGLNEISDIVETSYGYHIVKRIPFDLEGEQEKECMSQYEYNLAAPKIDDLVKEWKAEAKIEKNDKVYTAIEPIL